MSDSIVLCIPGPWEDRSALVRAVAHASSGQALAAGMVFAHSGLDASCEWTLDDHDPRMEEAFKASLMPDEPSGMSERIAQHKTVLYLIETDRGPEAAKKMVALSRVCLDAGGIGVKVEAAGKAFSDEKWRELSESPLNIHQQMVLHVVADEIGFWSCGNHQLGYPDTFVETTDFDTAVIVARTLEQFQLYEKPELGDGHTFSTDADSPKWRMEHVPHPYTDDTQIDRSLGMWRLERVS